MKVDWGTADVRLSANDKFSLHVRIVEVGGNAHYEAFEEATPRFGQKPGNEGRSIRRFMSGGDSWGILVRGIDANDVPGEQRRLDEFIAAVDAIAAPRQAELDAREEERRRASDERARQAEALTAQFRNGS